MPLRCHFLHFEITVEGNTAPKIIARSWSDAKRVEMAEKPQKNSKEACIKDWLSKEMEEFQNWENIKQKQEAGNIRSPKKGGFQPKWEGLSL